VSVAEGTLLWEPSPARRRRANITRYVRWLAANGYGNPRTYDELWRWSIEDLERFWETIWRFEEVQASRPYARVLSGDQMPHVTWFPGARLNFAQHVFRNRTPDRPALVWASETTSLGEISWAELESATASLAAGLQELGVGAGDRVVAVMPNIPETVIAFLATASIGAVWSACSPDFGTTSLIDRFAQIDPKVLIAVDGYVHKGRPFDVRGKVAELHAALPSLAHTILVPRIADDNVHPPGSLSWTDAVSGPARLEFAQVPADHPLWIVYTSGTSGLPKPIVHGHGGVLLERLKSVTLHSDVHVDDVYFWFTTTSWVMWNITISALLGCSTIVLYDGSPWYPDRSVLWDVVARTGATIFGTSAGFLQECMRIGLEPGRDFDLSRLHSIGVTASPLPPDGFEWVYRSVGEDLWLSPSSGGTDVASGFVVGCPTLPVYAGEIQCRGLGVDVRAADEHGEPIVEKVGELVVAQPMPSMPLYFWDDPDGNRYRESYFDTYPGQWRHGDWLKITSRGSAVIYGRSDATINRGGVRVGTSDIYRVVERVPVVLDSLVVELRTPRGSDVVLFVVTAAPLDDVMVDMLRDAVRRSVSPRHVPDRVVEVSEIPRTLTGKKLEVPVKRILEGAPREEALAVGAVANPAALEQFEALASYWTASSARGA
jgi:acetoacetyl-CoA synthetase